MKRHVRIAAFVLALSAYVLGETAYPASKDHQDQAATQTNGKLSKKDRKRLEKEEKKARDREHQEEKHEHEQQAKEQRKQYKEQEKQLAEQSKRERKEQEKQVASNRKKDEKYERKETERAQKEEARDMSHHIQREERIERASAAAAPRPTYAPRIPISTTATPGLLLAQREVSRSIYSQLPGSDVRVLLNGGSQIVLRGSAPTPSLRQRLLQLAIGAARGYSVVDQLAANFVGDAASAATSAAIGGVSNLIHGSGSKNNGPESGPPPPPDSAMQASSYPQQASAYPQQALPNNDAEAPPSLLGPGSNACVNVSNSNNVVLTGQATSQPSAELIRHFAHQLATPTALVIDQLAVRTTGGVAPAGSAPQNSASTQGGVLTATANPSTNVVSPGSTVCVTDNNGQIFLTGTVGSTGELGTVESAVHPLVGNGRLQDQLTVSSMSSGAQIASSAQVGSTTPPPAPETELEQALHSLPRLANVNVEVSADGVHLSGSVDTTQDDQMASDIVRQYSPGRPVVDNMAVANRSERPQY